MKRHSHLILGLTLVLLLLLPACGTSTEVVASTPSEVSTEVAASTPSATVVPPVTIGTNTPDPCAPENIEAEVLKIHKYMREFDDASNLASVVPVEQKTGAIAELQRIRREAEDQPTPVCLGDLKGYQISHMNSVINTLINMIGGQDQQTIEQGIAIARNQHDQYLIELARVLGLTIEASSALPAPTETPSPQ